MKKPRMTTIRSATIRSASGEAGLPDKMTNGTSDPTPLAATLDGGLLDAIAGAIAPVEPRAGRRALMRQRILDRVRDAKGAQEGAHTPAPSQRMKPATGASPEAGFVTVQPGEGVWQPLFAGVDMKLLHDHGDAQSFLLRLAPGASVPVHGHGSDELCVVLDGEVRLNGQIGRPGTFHLALADSEHMQVSTEHGCLLFLRANLEDGIRFR